MSRGLTLCTRQTHVHRYLDVLTRHIERGEIGPTVISTHRLSLDEAPYANKIFTSKSTASSACWIPGSLPRTKTG
ncbi:hypothetical protein [Deinococcus ficus]|uniref:hypothetical protein n=1 Tax=Deinococcus ficus TaxID=317577 RepID=UPI0003B53B63|nr:hypothetical protein [Deinococcus ficus]